MRIRRKIFLQLLLLDKGLLKDFKLRIVTVAIKIKEIFNVTMKKMIILKEKFKYVN